MKKLVFKSSIVNQDLDPHWIWIQLLFGSGSGFIQIWEPYSIHIRIRIKYNPDQQP
jgi:hypothetical protein